MKKIISILVAMLILASALPAFAEVTSTSSSYLAFDGMDYGEGKTIDPNADASMKLTSDNASFAAPDNKNITRDKRDENGNIIYDEAGNAVKETVKQIVTDATVVNGALEISVHADNGPVGDDFSGLDIYQYQQSQLYAIYKDFKSIKGYDELLYGFDIKIDGATHVREVIYKTDNTSYKANSYAVFAVGGRAASPRNAVDPNSTSGTYWYGGNNLAFYLTRNNNGEYVLDDNGMPYITIGSKTNMKQGEVYKVKVYLDYTTDKYTVSITDSQGNEEVCVPNGALLECLQDFGGISLSQGLNVTKETKVTIDNYFVDEGALRIDVPSSCVVSADGKINYSVHISDAYTSPEIYINDTFVESIEKVSGKNIYDITSTLPEGTTFGAAKIELKAVRNGKTVSGVANTTLIRENKVQLYYKADLSENGKEQSHDITGTVKLHTDASAVPGGVSGGLYEVAIEFKAPAAVSPLLGIRLSPGAVLGIANGTIFANQNNGKDVYAKWNHSRFSNVVYDDTTWNTAVWRVDYRGDATKNDLPYSITVNGVKDVEGTHSLKTVSGTASKNYLDVFNGFKHIRFNMGANVDIRNTCLYQIYGAPVATAIDATYTDVTTATYTDTPLSGHSLDKITFTLDQEVTNAEGNVSFVDANGNAVANTAVSVSGKVVTVDYSAESSLATGEYKLVIGKNAMTHNVTIGAVQEIPVEISSPDTVIAPANGANVSDGTITIKAGVSSAEKVAVYVNDEKIKEFDAPEADGIYECAFAPTKVGENYIDIYSYNSNGVELTSSSFIYQPYNKVDVYGTTFSSSSWSPFSGAQGLAADPTTKNKDGGFALKYTNNVTSGNRFVNMTYSTDAVSGGQRVAVREFDVKLGENTYISIELGVNSTGNKATSGNVTVTNPAGQQVSVTNYPNPVNWPGTDGKKMFDGNGTIAGSTYTWEAEQWYHVKHVIDFENKRVQVYITNEKIGNNVLVANMDISNHDLVKNVPDTIVSYSKYRIHIKPIDTTSAVMPSATFAYPATYQLKSVPAPSVASKTIVSGTDSVAVTLDKAYDALTADKVTVKANGVALEGAAVAVNGATITVSGLAGVKAGTKLEIAVSADAVFGGVAVGKESIATVFVADSNNVCLLPLKLESETGSDLWAYSKYISGAQSPLSTYFIMTEYADTAGSRVKQANFAPVTVEAGKVGAVSGYLAGITKAEGCQVMLWNTDFAPIMEAGKLAQ